MLTAIILASIYAALVAVQAYRERRARKQWERLVERMLERKDDEQFEKDARWGES